MKQVKYEWAGLQLYLKETPAQVFSCEYCEIFNNSFFYRTPLVAATVIVIINIQVWKWSEKSNFNIFVLADKTTDLYKMPSNQCEVLLAADITKPYRKSAKIFQNL